jgi:hypothetical protein
LNKEEDRVVSAGITQCKGDDEALSSDQGRVVVIGSSFLGLEGEEQEQKLMVNRRRVWAAGFNCKSEHIVE